MTRTRAEEFAGLSVAIVTPMKAGQIDFDRLGEQVEFQIAAGTTAVVAVGTTGESPTLDYEEHEKVIRATVEAAAGKIKVIAGTGANCTEETIRMTRWAEKWKADAALLVAPYYNKPMQEGFYQHFKMVAESVNLPLCLYNIPGRCAKNVEPQTIIRLAKIPNITMLKDATGALDQASQIMMETDLTVLSGDDSMTLPLMSIGGRGVVSVIGNIVPQDMISLCRAFDAGDMKTALDFHRKTFQLSRDMLSLATNPIPIKMAMKMLGRDTGELRLPMTPLEPNDVVKLTKTLREYGLDVEKEGPDV